jgi:hypothetical protein
MLFSRWSRRLVLFGLFVKVVPYWGLALSFAIMLAWVLSTMRYLLWYNTRYGFKHYRVSDKRPQGRVGEFLFCLLVRIFQGRRRIYYKIRGRNHITDCKNEDDETVDVRGVLDRGSDYRQDHGEYRLYDAYVIMWTKIRTYDGLWVERNLLASLLSNYQIEASGLPPTEATVGLMMQRINSTCRFYNVQAANTYMIKRITLDLFYHKVRSLDENFCLRSID